MSHVTLSTSATLVSLTRLFGGSEKQNWPFSRNSFQLRGIGRRKLRRAVSGAAGKNGGGVGASGDEKAQRGYVWPDKKRPRVCILGGGFGGLYTALRLESLVWPDDKKPQVFLINQSERFVFKPILYELLTGEVDIWEIAPFFSELLANTGIQFLQDRVKLLRPSDHEGMNASIGSNGGGGTVHLESGFLVGYDWYSFHIHILINVNSD